MKPQAITPQDLIDWIGLPVSHAQVRKRLGQFKNHGHTIDQYPQWSYCEDFTHRHFSLELTPRCHFENRDLNGKHPIPQPPFNAASGPALELVIKAVTLYPSLGGPLPLGLHFGMNRKAFRKLGVVYQTYKNTLLYMQLADYEVCGKFTDDQLAHLIFQPISADALQKIALKQNLKSQNKHINPNAAAELNRLLAQKPTHAWKKRMEDGDHGFSPPAIAASNTLLDRFIAELSAAAQDKKANKIYCATQKVVKGFNKLNQTYNPIETLERDELGIFIQRAVTTTGFQPGDGIDITAVWREW